MLDHSRLLSVWSILADLFFHLLETLNTGERNPRRKVCFIFTTIVASVLGK